MHKLLKGMVPMYLGKADVNTYDKGARQGVSCLQRPGPGFSTVIGANTESMGSRCPPGGRTSTRCWSARSKRRYSEKKKYQLSTNRYKDLVYPDGYRYLQEYKAIISKHVVRDTQHLLKINFHAGKSVYDSQIRTVGAPERSVSICVRFLLTGSIRGAKAAKGEV